jgi:hypothetical protein
VSFLGVSYLGSVVRVIVTQDGSDAVVSEISGLRRLEELIFTLQLLYLNHTAITDAGLRHLRKLKQLKYLNLEGTEVTDAGVHELRKAQPNAKIVR